MRKLLVITLAIAIAAVAFADDALVLPTGVIRARLTAAYAMASKEFDADADKEDLDGGDLKMINIGAALEYGIVDGINIAAQWIPGYVVYSEFDDNDAKVNGALDLFLGAKFQLIGDQGLASKNETMRLALAAGVVVPLPGADVEDQVDNALAGDDFIVQDADKHAFGIGGRAYFDYVINEMFFVNLYSEFIKYFPRDQEFMAFTPGPAVAEAEIGYGYQLTLEVEPHFETAVANGTTLKAGLPFTYVTTPELEVEGDAQDDTDGYSLNVRPNVALFLTSTPLPLEFELGYLIPIVGKNSVATSAITLQVKAFAKI